jgi:hypothetical protein
MTKLRSRLLVTLVLAAVALAAVGIDVASARASRRNSPWSSGGVTSRPRIGSFVGEPDPSGSGAPLPVVKPAYMTPAPNLWMAQLWIQWRMRSQIGQHQPKR